MARKAKKDDAVKAMKRPSPEDVKRAIGEASRLKTQAAEYGGFHGQHVKGFVEKFDINRKAFNFARSLHDMDEGKREAVIVDFLELADKLGFLDQGSLFDSVRERAANIADRLASGPKPGPGVGGDVLAKLFGDDELEHGTIAGDADGGAIDREMGGEPAGGDDLDEFDRIGQEREAQARRVDAAAGDAAGTMKPASDAGDIPAFLDRRGETVEQARKRQRAARKALDLPDAGDGAAVH